MRIAPTAWSVGGRLSRRGADRLAHLLSPVLSVLPLAGVRAWAATVNAATGCPPTRRQRRLLLENWLRNALWSMGLARWPSGEVVRVTRIDAADVQKLRESLAGPGLVLALPHMGSWDCAGAWAAQLGMPVVSVAERLPGGLFERFREARGAIGITVLPVDLPDLLARLAADVRDRRLVCLVSDRDLSSRGLVLPWPGGGKIRVPAGPALLALRTGADLRVATTRFDGEFLHLEVSDRLAGATPRELMASAVEVFADAIRRSPENWLMLRQAVL